MSSEENALLRHLEQHLTNYPAYSIFLEDLNRIIDEERQRQTTPSGEGLKRIEEDTKVVKDDITENQGRPQGNFKHKRLLMHAIRNMAATHLSLLLRNPWDLC
jgi:hypothetical protein